MAQPPPPEPGSSAELLALVAAYQIQTQQLRDRVERYVRSLWRSLGEYRDAQLVSYVRDVVPVVLGAQTQMSSLTSAYLAHQKQYALGTPFRPVAVDLAKVTGAGARNGNVMPDIEHARPFTAVWIDLHDQIERQTALNIDKAIALGEQRAVGLALDDVQLAKTHTAQLIAQDDKRLRYTERVLEGESSCGLCIVASTQRYRAAELMPIHGGCDCSQEFVYVDKDPGKLVHLERLQNVHDRIQERFGASSPAAQEIPGTASNYDMALMYRDVLVTHEHGELGSVLGVRGQDFTGPSDLA